MNETTLLKRDIKMLKEQQVDSIALLKVLSKQVGTHLGEEIDKHIALLNGQRFNAKEWDFADRNGEQGV